MRKVQSSLEYSPMASEDYPDKSSDVESSLSMNQLDILKTEAAKREYSENRKDRIYAWIVLLLLLSVQISN